MDYCDVDLFIFRAWAAAPIAVATGNASVTAAASICLTNAVPLGAGCRVVV